MTHCIDREVVSVRGRHRMPSVAFAAGALLLAACGGSFSAAFPGGQSPGVVQELPFAPVNADRQDHTATTLDTNDVVIVGGANAGGFVGAAERYVRVGQRFDAAGTMVVPRALHTATRLGDDRVLITGGQSAANAAEASTELYDRRQPLASAFAAGVPLAQARRRHTATFTNQSTVVVCGGDDGQQPLGLPAEIERFSADGQTVQTIGNLQVPRTRHRAVWSPDIRRVVVLGGDDQTGNPTGVIEFIDPATGASTVAARGLIIARRDHAALTMPDGRIFVCGGRDATNTALAHAELYDPVREQSASVATMPTPRGDPRLALLFAQSRVVVTGDGQTVDIFSTHDSSFTTGTALFNARVRHTITPAGFELLIFGGAGAQAPAEVFLD